MKIITQKEFFRVYLLKGLLVFFLLFLPFCLYSNYIDRDINNIIIIFLFSCMIGLAFALIADMFLFLFTVLFIKDVGEEKYELPLYEIVEFIPNNKMVGLDIVYKESKESQLDNVFVDKFISFDDPNYKLVSILKRKRFFNIYFVEIERVLHIPKNLNMA